MNAGLSAAPDAGAGASTGGQPAQGSAPTAPSYVEIDGQQVSIDELRNGYLRQQDYTRKTQELSRQRAQYQAAVSLAESLRTDPVGTLREIAQQLGVDPRQLAAQASVNEEPGQPDFELDPNDPIHRELIESRRMIEDLRQGQEQILTADIDAWLDAQEAQIQQMAEQLGLEADMDAVYDYAINNNIDDPLVAFRSMVFDDVAARAGESSSLPDMSGLKRQVAFQGARNTPAPNISPNDQPQPMSIAEALAQTLADEGIRDFSQVSNDDTYGIHG